MPKIKAILFDMDGVLIDAKDWHYESLNKALVLFGLEISRHEHLSTFDGLPTKKKLEMISAESGLPKSLHQFINDLKQDFVFQIGYARCKPTFSHQYALAHFKDQGFKLVCCSNSIRKTMDIFLNKAAIDHYFEFYLSNEDVTEPKPNPEIYTKAIRKLCLKPTECLIIEDNENGVTAANNSGAHVLVVQNTNEVNFHSISKKIAEIESAL